MVKGRLDQAALPAPGFTFVDEEAVPHHASQKSRRALLAIRRLEVDEELVADEVVIGFRSGCGCVLDADETPLDEGVGRLAIKGPTGCRYLDDPRQREYVVNGWNVTGDTYRKDADGYFWYLARSDDMIVSSGYNIGAPEVENAL